MKPTSDMLNSFLEEKQFDNINKGIGRATIDSESPNVIIIKEHVNLVTYYNDVIQPLADIFKPMATRAGICPFHKDTDPSFHAHIKKKFYHCFGCGYTGSVIAVHRQIRFNYDKVKLTEEEAIIELANRYKVKILPQDQLREKSMDIFEMAKMMLLDQSYNTKYTGEITLASFEKNNKRLVNMPLDLDKKLSNLSELDLQIAAYLTGDE